MTTEMKNDLKSAFLTQYKETIDYILSATQHDKDEEWARNRVAANLRRALVQSARKGGKITDPKHTILYKFALLTKDCKNSDEFKVRFHQIIPKYTIERFLKSVDLEWKPAHFDLPTTTTEKPTTFTAKTELPEKKPNIIEVVKKLIDDMLKEPLQYILNINDDFNTLKGRVEELHEKFGILLKNNEIEDGIMNLGNKIDSLKRLLQTHEHANGKVVAPVEEIRLV
jgi:hypothetical protein